MAELILFHCSHGREEPERATVPFIAANAAAVSGQRAAVVCTVEAVWFGTPGGADGVAVEGMPPLAELIDGLVAAGGEVWLCSACANRRGIGEGDLREGARIVGAAELVAHIAEGARSVTLT